MKISELIGRLAAQQAPGFKATCIAVWVDLEGLKGAAAQSVADSAMLHMIKLQTGYYNV